MAKILVIEDETLLREEVMEWLTIEGYEAIGAADGVEGVHLAFHHLPDVILCDIAMPRMDGYEVMLNIRADSTTQLTPFIYMTAKASQDDMRVGMSLGADDYITKPFTYNQLVQAVKTRLDKKVLQEHHKQMEIDRWREALEKEEEMRLLKSRMVAMFSHDFRNPLASILSSNDILHKYSDRLDEPRRLIHFKRVEASVRQLIQMMDEMLAVAQMEAGSLDFKPVPMNMMEFLQQIVEEFQLIHGETHSFVLKSQFTDALMADPRLLRQIMVNLISNAVKYSPRGSEVTTTLQSCDQHVELMIEDQGIGIPEADQGHLFNAFQRATNVGGISGTGLGLTIVQQAVDLHSGTIELKSTINVGTRVTVRLPL